MIVAHFDIDAFYASVEVRDDPQLQGKPVAVAGASRRAVVLTASYEARPYGVRSAIPLYRALELCPQLIVVRPNMEKYKRVSREIFAIFAARGHAVEGLSLDEAFVDFAECTFAQAVALAGTIRAEVRAATGLAVSSGVAGGKMVAKIACDVCKPNGLLAVAAGEEEAFLAGLPASRLWGVGPKTATRLAASGITTIGEIAALDNASAARLFGSSGRGMRDLARGVDQRRVESQRETKSISTEETFEYDVCDERRLADVLHDQARDIALKLEREQCVAGTIGIKIKTAELRLIGRQMKLNEPTRDGRRIFRAALFCLRRAQLGGVAVRLIGLRAASLSMGDARQLGLFAPRSIQNGSSGG
jgi:DNA polymerase-4